MQISPQDCKELDDWLTEPLKCVNNSIDCLGDRVVVLGAGGKMGFHLCLMLRKALDRSKSTTRVIAVSRFSDSGVRDKFDEAGIETQSCDLTKESAVQALPDCDSVFFLAGLKFGSSERPALLQLFNVRMPQIAAERYRRSRFVVFSTGCVYAFTTPESGGSKELDRTDPPGDYAQSCPGARAGIH